jgi:hypothetical protein
VGEPNQLRNAEALVSSGQSLTNDKLTYLAIVELYSPRISAV